ncbi:lipid particle protein [Rhizoctonia solani]|uniref:Lipid particle protein n=1 Tax=Rhizoctonia solani TaxID=456999 RepID=A0A8H7I8Q3_9AGAM|nr:lipid particle protein [Rhizoctonia solani]
MSSSSSTIILKCSFSGPCPRHVGTPEHLARVEETIKEKYADVEGDTEFVSLRIRTNAESHTYDGLDWGAERAVKEYSLSTGFLPQYQTRQFYHLCHTPSGLPRIRGLVGTMMHKLGPKMLSRTGKQFYGVDKDIWSPDDKEGRPLLEVMADKDSVFFKALKSFPHVTFYGNAVNDLTVVYVTSMVEVHDPFVALKTKSHRLGIKMDPKYKHVIESFGEVPAGEEVPLSEIELEDRARKAALHWYSPSRYRTSRPFLPPFLQFPFPLNLVFYLLLPFLIPAGLTYATIRFNRESRSSGADLKLSLTHPTRNPAWLQYYKRWKWQLQTWSTRLIRVQTKGGIACRNRHSRCRAPSEETRKRKATRPDTPEAAAAQSLPTPPAEEDADLSRNRPFLHPRLNPTTHYNRSCPLRSSL